MVIGIGWPGAAQGCARRACLQVDYRIEKAYRAFNRAVIPLERLDTGHDPELDTAIARLRTQWHDDMPSETTGG